MRIANLRSFERCICVVHSSAAGVVAWFPEVVGCNWSGSGLGFGAASELCCICAHSFLANMAPTLTRQIFPKHFRSAAWQVAHKSACSSTSIEIPLLLVCGNPYLLSRQPGRCHHSLGRSVSGVLSCKGPGPDATTTSSSHL